MKEEIDGLKEKWEEDDYYNVEGNENAAETYAAKINAKFKRRMRKRSEDGSLKERKAGRKKRQLEGKSQLEEKKSKC